MKAHQKAGPFAPPTLPGFNAPSGRPNYKHEPVYTDDHVVAFLSRYPTPLGYTIVAPRIHIVDVTGDRELLGRVTDLVHDVAEALKATLPTERVYLMSLGSHTPTYTGTLRPCHLVCLTSGNSSMQ